MLKNGYYYPLEMDNHLMHIEGDNIVGDAQIGISFGNRTAGKTVGHGIRLINRFEKYSEQAVLLARTDKQKNQDYLRKWFQNKILNVEDADGIIQTFKKSHKIEYSQDEITVDKKVFLSCLAISMSHEVKDTFGGQHVTNIIMDEATQGEPYLIINGRPAIERITEIWQTVARGYPNAEQLTNLIFIANISNLDNWLFNDYGLHRFISTDTKQTCQGGYFIDIVNNTNASAKLHASVMGKILEGTAALSGYYNAAQNNEYRDNNAFVIKRGLDFTRLKLQFIIDEQTIGAFDDGDRIHLALIRKDHRSKKLIKNLAQMQEGDIYDDSTMSEWLKNMIAIGKITFQDIQTKGAVMRYIGLL